MEEMSALEGKEERAGVTGVSGAAGEEEAGVEEGGAKEGEEEEEGVEG